MYKKVQKNMQIKEFQNENIKQILELFEKVFHKKMTIKFWNWRFDGNPFGNPFIKLAFIGKDLIASYLIHPIILEFDNKKNQCLFSMTTMTDRDFSGKGIMTKLASESYKKGKNDLYKIVFLFANKNSRHMFTKKLDFKELRMVRELSLEHKEMELDVRGKVTKINKFDNGFDSFFEL